jgi:hypothetical protein
MTTSRTIRGFLLFEALTFAVAASIHFGLLFTGGEHQRAGIAESVIAGVLALGLVSTSVRPAATRAIGVAVQGFALLGTLVGILTIAIGVGPRTAPDVIYHAGIVAVLAYGIVVARRAKPAA